MGDDYAQALEREGRDLVEAARKAELRPVWFRETEIGRILGHLDARRSVLVTGAPGVGKTAVIHGTAIAMQGRGRGAMRQLSTSQIMSGTRYIGDWQSKITRIAEGAEKGGVVLYVTDIVNLATVGKTSNDPSCLLDALRPLVETGRVSLIGEADPDALRRITKTPAFAPLLQQVPVAAITAEQVDRVLELAARADALAADAEVRRTLVQVTARFLPARPQPGPALELLAQVRDLVSAQRAAGEGEALTPAYVEKVFSATSGLPLFVVSPKETRPAREIRAWFEERLVGQREAIDAVVETIALYKAGLQDPRRPVGSFLFVGPTGVGKTELARLLATFLFGSPARLLRFDMSELKDYHSFEQLIGAPEKPDQPARLIDPVRNQPFQVVLFDELEKAHANVFDLFLQLLDEGQLTPPGGQPISFRNTILIATSNAGAQETARSLGFGAGTDLAARAAAVRAALERQFRPEFLNRFGHVVVFHPLTTEQVRTVARQELARVLAREGITARNLVVDVGDDALDLVIARAVDERWGARALKRELQRQLVLPIALTLMEREVEPGSVLTAAAKDGAIRVRVVETAGARSARREREPVKVAAGVKLGRAEVAEGLPRLRAAIAALARDMDEPFLHKERARLLELRAQKEFWSFPEDAAMAIRDLERYGAWLDRVDRLRARADDIEAALAGADLRRNLSAVAHRFVQLDEALAEARRELVTMGGDGVWDALVEIRPLTGGGRAARDLLVRVYGEWAEHRHMRVDWLREPAADDEPAMLAIAGHHAFGYLAGERGLHKLRDGESSSVAAVRTGAWTDLRRAARFTGHRPLRGLGQHGGALRSRLECDGGLVLQNARTLADNRELAGELAMAWSAARPAPDEIVRRYDLHPFLLRDVLTDESSGRADILEPRGFHELLCRRVDLIGPDRPKE
ncbi:MAG TPA: AAA family ATPase [Kofleriaceae bacterium]|nr:AAA family ATPase [Kofleriaceae bacterium]